MKDYERGDRIDSFCFNWHTELVTTCEIHTKLFYLNMKGTAKYSSFAHTGMKSMKMVGSLSLETLKQVLIDHFLGIIYEYIYSLFGLQLVAVLLQLQRT